MILLRIVASAVLCLNLGTFAAQIGHKSAPAPLETLCNNRGIAWIDVPEMKQLGIPRNINLNSIPKTSGKACTPMDGTAGVNNGEENLMWYYREDLQVNAQHIFWHMALPQHLIIPDVPLDIDRRGEMFYYFHRNMIARYDTERMSNGLDRVVPLDYQEGALVPGGYDPHLLEAPHNFRYPRRLDNEKFENIQESVEMMNLLLNDIDMGRLFTKNGTTVSLNNWQGINMLGESIEASINSVNDERYSVIGIHSQGHRNLGTLHVDIGESVGDDLVCAVIFNPSTAMRDTVFYRWHKVVDNIFLRHKDLLPPHQPVQGDYPLLWPGVSVESISVKSETVVGQNSLKTFFEDLTVSIPLTEDIFFVNQTHDYCVKRLNHEGFTYNITINKQASTSSNKATVRIFMAPRFNQTGGRYSFIDQTRLFFALDSFVVDLNVGSNQITRHSSESTLLGKWKLDNWTEHTPDFYHPQCGCGWPAHLLLPKGTVAGMVFDLFVMVTDAEIDTVVDDVVLPEYKQEPQCTMGQIWCGIQDRKYPDVRPMGYPFDTKPFSILSEEGSRLVSSLEEYVSLLANTQATQVTITHAG